MWETKKLNQLCDIQSGLWKGKKEPFTEAYVLRNTNFTSGGKFNYSNVVALQVETKQLEKRLLLPNDIILEKSGGGEKTPVGRVCLHTSELDKPVSFSNFTARLRVLDEKELAPAFLHRFLYFLYISGKTKPMQRNSTGIRNLQITQYKDIAVPLPPIAEQQRIVAKLDAAFAEIDEAIQLAKTKETEVAQLKEVLLTASLNKGTVIPNKTVKLKEVTKVIAGQSPASENYNKNGIGTPFMQGKKDYGDKFPNPPTVWTTSITKLAEKGDILMSVRAPVGALNIANQRVCIGRGLAAIRASEKISLDYLFYLLLQISANLEGTSGAIFNSINKKQIEEIEFMLPTLVEQQLIVAKLDSAFAEIEFARNAVKRNQLNYQVLKSAILSQELQSGAA